MSRWFKNAVFYSLDVETFLDSNNDGVGDFQGLISKLDYLSGLGVTCIWLLPFFPSPNHDNGYDVEDYYNVDNRLGDLGDFVQFIAKCRELGIRVVIDLVINHTSIKHPWFREARKNKDSIYHEFYIWSDKPKPFYEDKLFFHGEEHTVWTYDKVAKQYYLHRFYKEQPDLNIASKALREEIKKIIGFWLSLRVDGFRVDAAETLIETYGMNRTSKKHLESFLDELRSFVASKNPDAILLAEANIHPNKVHTYLKGNERMHMMFGFYINQHIFLALAKQNAQILAMALNKLPECTEDQQWLNFLRHHDELSLDLLSPEQTKSVFKSFAPDEAMRIYKTGIRRRLAPMVNNDQAVLQMLYSLLFSLPGATLIRYGDEIGMGDNLTLEGRSSVRTPMQWSSEKNGGFSSAHPRSLVHPVVSKGEFGSGKINVLSQQRDPDSLLNFIERVITTRKQTPEIGNGKIAIIENELKAVLIHRCESEKIKMIFIHNFTDEVFTIPLSEFISDNDKVFEILCDGQSVMEDELLILNAFGFLWLRIENKK